jgi:hypothetical protein
MAEKKTRKSVAALRTEHYAKRLAGHSNAKTTGLYDRRNDDISISEVERVGI